MPGAKGTLNLAVRWLARIVVGLAASAAGAAAPPNPAVLLAQAVAADLGGDPVRALTLYRRSADAGSAPAQLNVAVMLDSGRGTGHDAAGAATYYAMAASQGVARAAYDLGQLYADGEGVPVNAALARAWLRLAGQAGLGAAAARLRDLPAGTEAAAPTAPTPIHPSEGTVLAHLTSLQLVWTSAAQPAGTSYFVEVTTLQPHAAHDVFTAGSDVSALAATGAVEPGRYAWRVFTICPSLGRYVPSAWVFFSIG